MRKKVLILVSLSLLVNANLLGQCAGRNDFLNQIIHVRDSSKLSLKERTAELLSKLENIGDCPYKNDSIHAYLLRSIGVLYRTQGDFLNAANYFSRSIDVIVENSNSPNISRKPLLSAYLWLSIFYDSLNNQTKKMEAVNNCIEVARESNSFLDISSIQALYKKAEHCFDIGDYHSCINYANMCQKFAWKCADVNKGNPDYYSVAVEYALSGLGWNVEALLRLNDYNTVAELLTDKFEECKKRGLRKYYGMIYDQLAHVEMHNNNYKKASLFLVQSLKYEEEVANFFNCKQVLNTIGYDIYFHHYNDHARALFYYKKALRYSNRGRSIETKDSIESLNIYGRIANVYVKENLFDSAFKYYQLAFDQIKPGINETDILHFSTTKMGGLKKINYVSALLIDKGDAFGKLYTTTGNQGAIKEAVRIYKTADAFLDSIKTGLADLQSKLFWRRDARRLYENAIEACHLQNNVADAFYFFEKSRAVLLQDQLNEQHWSGEQDILKQTQLEKKILQLERELNNSNKTLSNYSELENELFNSKEELGRVRELVKTNNPLYYQSFVDKNFITIKDVGDKILRDHQAVVELFAGDSSVYILVITEQKSYLEKINKIDFDRLSDTYRDYISNQDLINKHFIEFKNLSLQLYRLIFQNINLPIGRIIISPDGKYFPFEALVTNTNPLTYFLEAHAVSYTYSARYLLNNFNTKSTSNSYTFMGIAPVNYHNLASLSGSDQSLQKIKGYFRNAVNLTGIKASKNNFLTEYDKYKIIQLYTHATVSGSAGEPMIYFSDSVLSLSDLFYESKPATSLIVLSACETAEGKLYNGEGVFSFNRQFAALGIPSCVSNLWQIDNRSTYKLTELFYKYISNGMPLDIALQKAKKEFRKTVSSTEQDLPYYWAAPILVGQSNKIPLPKTFPWKWVALVSFLLALSIWSLRKFMNNRLTVSHSSLKGL